MIDIAHHLKAIHREVAKQRTESGEVVGVLLRRDYNAGVQDVWDALTDPERIKRWFLPVSGDLRAGGTFQLEGNAGGDILTCEPPKLLKLTFGGPTSLVELRLTSTGDEDTVLELDHTVPIEFAGSGAGAFYVGPGWDGAFLALALFLNGMTTDDPAAAANSPEAQEFSRQSVHAWAVAVESSGTATADEIAAGKEMSLAQFAPDTTQDEALPPRRAGARSPPDPRTACLSTVLARSSPRPGEHRPVTALRPGSLAALTSSHRSLLNGQCRHAEPPDSGRTTRTPPAAHPGGPHTPWASHPVGLPADDLA